MSKTKQAQAQGPQKEAKPTQGGVGTLARKLLTETNQSYPEIVESIRAQHPDAKTTARSVASIACVLRKQGVQVPMRRTSKKEG